MNMLETNSQTVPSKNLKSFDSAKECEKFANEMSRKVMIQRNKDTKSVLFTEIYMFTRCIPSGSLQLKEK